jgi:hypothetical protein
VLFQHEFVWFWKGVGPGGLVRVGRSMAAVSGGQSRLWGLFRVALK